MTDAALLAGWLSADYFLGGQLRVHPDRGRIAYARLGAALGLSAEAAAVGALRLANANLANALKLVSIQRGHDPRDFALVTHGGGGAMHAGFLARDLRFKCTIVPRLPGVFSAWGMLLVDPRVELVRTRVGTTDTLGDAGLLLEEMKAEARRILDADGLRFEAAAEVRYVGQEHTVRIPLAMEVEPGAAAEAFHAAHFRRYRFALRSTPVEFVNFYLSAYRPSPHPNLRPLDAARRGSSPSPKAARRAFFDADGWLEAPVFERDDLPPGFEIGGPVIVEEKSTTTVVPPDMHLQVDEYGNLRICC